MSIEGFGIPYTLEYTWKSCKGKGVSHCVLWRRKEMAYENGIQWIWVRKEIKAPTFIMRSLPSKEMGDIGSIKKK